jgi:transglutaminase-like putative cysteine protease
MLPAKDRGTSILELSAAAPVENSRLVFRFKTELAPLAQIKFTVYIDNKAVFSTGGMSGWQQKVIPVQKGNHSFRFEVTKTTTSYGQGIKNAVFLDDIALVPEPAAPQELRETFDGDVSIGMPESLWTGNAKIISPDSDDFANSTRFAELSAPLMAGSSFLEALTIAPETDSSLSFRFKTEIASGAAQTFKVYLDNKEMGSWEGLGMMWRLESFPVPAGAHSLRFEVSSKGRSVQGGYNAVFIDDITLIPDTASSLALEPLGSQQTFVGAPVSEKIRFSAATFREDGSVKARSTGTNSAGFVFSVSADDEQGVAEIDSNGVFTAQTEGTFTVTAKKDGYTATSDSITVRDADYLLKPYFYSGTGQTYQGFTRAVNAEKIPQTPFLAVSEPLVRNFEADGFFTLQAAITKPSAKHYAHVSVTKNSPDEKKLSTFYIVHDSFIKRIWLPFGRGEYTITISVLDSVRLTTPPGGLEGDFRGGTFSTDSLTLTVYNTREEQGIDGDGRWMYPSWQCQSDTAIITNLLNDILYRSNAQTEIEKTKAVHDYLVTHLVYDTDSFRNDSRARKMDAISVLQNGTGVCEGYSHLSAALLRAAGIPVRIVNSRAVNHAWNNVYIGGAWKFYDATWDDPVPDRGSYFVDYTYFLLDSLTGGDNRHRGSGNIVIGDVEAW